ncbi:MAG: hypothetical protein PCFJNLEI_02279 [Verrucomicrobiae bacterium]|nr:hypothetical protein [Verrucomicrobiae bacterium]
MNAAAYIHSLHAHLAIQRAGEVVSREEYLDYMTFRANSRPLFTEIFGPLLGLRDEWKTQGATPDELSFAAFRYRNAQEANLPVNTGWLGGDAPVILEESDDQLVYRDHMGRRMEMAKKAATLALPTTYPVTTMDDWRRIKHHYEFSATRVGEKPSVPGKVMTAHIPGGFDEPRQLMGEEALALACYEQPELIHDILQTIGDTAVRVLAGVEDLDQLAVHEDMAGRSGPLLGPKQVEEFIAPYYRRVWAVAQERGARLFKQDSDGDMRPVLPAFVATGLNVIYPCEPTAGMDIVKLREEYGRRLAFIGGIDKHVLRRSREEIVAELEYKIPPLVKSGGCVFGLDHRIPNGTPLANYRFYMQKVWELL